jgi:arylformamidase
MGLKVYDISPLISEKLAVFPGDKSFQKKIAMSFEQGDHLMLSSILTTVHLGAHADAPNHYHEQGVAIAERSLDFYLGPCQLMTVSSHSSSIELDALTKHNILTPRILFRTNSFSDPQKWHSHFMSVSPAVIKYLAEKKVRLIGIDTPSIDPADSKHLLAHKEIFVHDMAILEGLVFTDVPDGIYFLIALPLKLEGLDASPVRAVLLPQHQPLG